MTQTITFYTQLYRLCTHVHLSVILSLARNHHNCRPFFVYPHASRYSKNNFRCFKYARTLPKCVVSLRCVYCWPVLLEASQCVGRNVGSSNCKMITVFLTQVLLSQRHLHSDSESAITNHFILSDVKITAEL